MTEKTIVQVAMNRQGVLGRRGFLKSMGLGAAGLAGLKAEVVDGLGDDLAKEAA